MNALIFLIFLVLGMAVYFTPTIVVNFRPQAKNKNLLFLANLLLGWTFIGWIGCLIWALVSGSERTKRMAEMANTYGPRAVDEFLDKADKTLKDILPEKEKKTDGSDQS